MDKPFSPKHFAYHDEQMESNKYHKYNHQDTRNGTSGDEDKQETDLDGQVFTVEDYSQDDDHLSLLPLLPASPSSAFSLSFPPNKEGAATNEQLEKIRKQPIPLDEFPVFQEYHFKGALSLYRNNDQLIAMIDPCGKRRCTSDFNVLRDLGGEERRTSFQREKKKEREEKKKEEREEKKAERNGKKVQVYFVFDTLSMIHKAKKKEQNLAKVWKLIHNLQQSKKTR